jgi:hypothetical protein
VCGMWSLSFCSSFQIPHCCCCWDEEPSWSRSRRSHRRVSTSTWRDPEWRH